MLKYATPPFVLTYVAIAMLWRQICKKLDSGVCELPSWARYYTLLFIVYTWVTIASIRSMVLEVLIAAPGLDPSRTEDHVRELMRHEEEDFSSMFDKWKEEASLRDYPCVRYLSLASPFFLIATYFTIFGHIGYHLVEMRKGGFNLAVMEASQRDKVIRILVLPLMYGLMCFQGSLRMWGVTMNYVSGTQHYRRWQDRRTFLHDAYEGAVNVADLYESYALFVFGTVVIKVLRQQIDERVHQAKLESFEDGKNAHLQRRPTSVLACEKCDGKGQIGIFCNICPKCDGKGKIEDQSKLNILIGSVVDLLDETKDLTMLGIKLFVTSCVGQSLCKLGINGMAFYGIAPEYFGAEGREGEVGLFQTEHFKEDFKMFWSGAGFIASFAAISNILSLEHGFHSYLKRFKTFLKFLGTKILVTIAFIQFSLLLSIPPFCYWTRTRIQLLYTSMLTIECFLISLSHLWAWPPHEDWYTAKSDGGRSYRQLGSGAADDSRNATDLQLDSGS